MINTATKLDKIVEESKQTLSSQTNSLTGKANEITSSILPALTFKSFDKDDFKEVSLDSPLSRNYKSEVKFRQEIAPL